MSRSDDLRMGALLTPITSSSASDKCEKIKHKVALIGYPCDLGVARNGGVVGAKGGPEAVRRMIQKVGPLINPEFSIDIRCIDFRDAGDIDVKETLEDTHLAITKTLQEVLKDGYLPIIVGGGNDQSFPNACALMQAFDSGRVGVVNIDAHLDARPLVDGKPHSGSPFRQLLEHEKFVSDRGMFHEFGVQGNQCSYDHVEYVKSKGGQLTWLSELRRSNTTAINEFEKVLSRFSNSPTFVSFDIDSIASCDCPGVSCPAAIGLTAQEALDICFISGKNPDTKMLDISEFNPSVEEKRTSRLVATMIYYFLLGLATRK